MPLCPNKLNSCDCSDDPLNNTSSEDLDEQVSCAVVNFTGNPGLGQCFGELSSTEVCCSKESIQDAQLCALRRAQENVFGSWTEGSCPPSSDPPLDCAPPCLPPAVPPFGGPAVPIYFNHAQECETVCADGQTFTWSVRAGIITSAISQLDADAKAVSLACQQARRNRLCFADDFLPVGCVNELYVFQLDAVGGTAPYTWAVITGSLPAGLTMDTSGSISGTPTTGETATFQVELTDDIGSIQVKTFVLSIAAIAPTSLPDGTIGTAYVSQQFTVTPAHDEETEVWTLSSGTLPDGLTLSTAGLLNGTPTGTGASYNLTFQVKFEDTASGKTVTCAKALTLTVNAAPVTTNCPGSNTLNNLPASVSCSDLDAVMAAYNLSVGGDWGSIDPMVPPGIASPVNESYKKETISDGGPIPDYYLAGNVFHNAIDCNNLGATVWTLTLYATYNNPPDGGGGLPGPSATYVKTGGIDPRGTYTGGADFPLAGWNPPATVEVA